MNPNTYHISLEDLTNLAFDELSDSDSSGFTEHLNACSDCTGQLSEIRQLSHTLANHKIDDVPAYLEMFALRQFDRHGPLPVNAEPSPLQRVFGVLLNDSRALRPAYGIRSGLPSAVNQILYNIGKYDLDLRVEEIGESWSLQGQVLGCQKPGEIVVSNSEISRSEVLNELAEFEFMNIPAGTYTLLLTFSEVQYEIPDLKIGKP